MLLRSYETFDVFRSFALDFRSVLAETFFPLSVALVEHMPDLYLVEPTAFFVGRF